jgi:hypothetical protein
MIQRLVQDNPRRIADIYLSSSLKLKLKSEEDLHCHGHAVFSFYELL